MTHDASRQPTFLWGAQYYRAPTPSRTEWATDLRKMRELGFNHVKFWLQWRWTHRRPNQFFFDDLDELLVLAHQNGLDVTLNAIFDVAPVWLFEKHPDAKVVLGDGTKVEPCAYAHRQIGGHPGPCLCHPGALEERKRFFQAALEHFADAPAVRMWDVWNEPELCFPQRWPVDFERLACYCPHCRTRFIEWLRKRYNDDLERLNHVWGRCYAQWREIEMPRSTRAVNDFIDWRDFHCDVMTGEAAWRLRMARELAPDTLRYLHVCANTQFIWNSVSCCADEFAMADGCDVFAASTTGKALPTALWAAPAKICYNVEDHLNGGALEFHQRRQGIKELCGEILPQLAMGFRGFLFWQYRPETLGEEAPGWGLVEPDGSDRPVTTAVREFSRRLKPYFDELLIIPRPVATIGVWKSRRNELFHAAIRQMELVHRSYTNLFDFFYQNNYNCRFIDSAMLEHRLLDGLKVLFLPLPYYLSDAECAALADWVAQGGILVSEAHLAAYSSDDGRHAAIVPGGGLADRWGFRETGSTAAAHLRQPMHFRQTGRLFGSDDLRKAFDSTAFSSPYYPVASTDGLQYTAYCRYAEISGTDMEIIGLVSGMTAPVAIRKCIGAGQVFYFGSDLFCVERPQWDGLENILTEKILAPAGIVQTSEALQTEVFSGKVRLELLSPDYLFVEALEESSDFAFVLPAGQWLDLCNDSSWNGGMRLRWQLAKGDTTLLRRTLDEQGKWT